jgi:hypothetical protein
LSDTPLALDALEVFMWDLTLIPVEKPVLPVPLTTVENLGYNAMLREERLLNNLFP